MIAQPGVRVEHGPLGEAHFSADDIYRFLLTRNCGNELPTWWVTMIGINPSTANHEKNDNTITKFLKFAHRFCEGWQGPREMLGVQIVNLYAFRSPYVRDCFAYPKPVGGLVTDYYIREACKRSAIVVAAWGPKAKARARASEVRNMLVGAGVKLHRLGAPTKDGTPSHPLFLADDTELQEWC